MVDAEEKIPDVKVSIDEKPVIKPRGEGSGNDEDEGIEYVRTSFAGEGTGTGTKQEPFIMYEDMTVE